MIELKGKDLEEIKAIARGAYPHEGCGVLVGLVEDGVKKVTEVIPAENERTDSPVNRYLITGEFVHRLEQQLLGSGKSILGFFHSHPDVAARPSSYDQEHAWPWYSYLIVSVCKGTVEEVKNWRLSDDRSRFDAEKLKLL